MGIECKSPVSRVTRYSSHNICISYNSFQLSFLNMYLFLSVEMIMKQYTILPKFIMVSKQIDPSLSILRDV